MSSDNKNTHFMVGVAAGAAVAYLLSNKQLMNSLLAKGGAVVSSTSSELEELKEKLEDTQAELEYYRNLNNNS